tara:strand:+ start:2290 stop:4329 length:2040 start_codon:yes stop_codon:yes gene_type:complete
MAIQFKRGTSSNRTNYTPAAGELLLVDITSSNPSLYVGDGSTAGGKLVSASGSGGGGGASNAFSTIAVTGQSNVEAENSADTLTLIAGSNITLTTNATNDSITINNTYSAPAETDPIFTAHASYNITSTKITNWDSAFGWGDHAQQNYFDKDTDSVGTITDVDTSTNAPQNNQVLTWQSNKWVPQTFTASGTLAGLAEVNVSGASNGKILEYNNGNWVVGDKGSSSGGVTTFTGLTDVPANYTNGSNLFVKVNTNATGLVFSTIVATSPLFWNAATSTISFSGTTNDLSEGSNNLYYTDARVDARLGIKDYVQDADFTSSGLMKRDSSVGSYSVVTDNSGNWNTAYGWGDHSLQNYFDKDTDTLSSISGVTISSPANNQILRYNGSAWTNSDEVVTTTFTALTDTPSGYSTAGKILSSTGSGVEWITNTGGSGLADIIEDTTPQLGGELDSRGFAFATSVINGNVTLKPNGTGHVELVDKNLKTTGQVYFGNTFSSTGNLPSASLYAGMFARVGTSSYFSNSSSWTQIANLSDVPVRTTTIYYTNGNFGSSNDSRNGKYILRGTTVDNNYSEIFVGGTSNSRIDFQDNSINTVSILVTGTRTGTIGGASFKVEASFQNSAGTLTLLDNVSKTKLGSSDTLYDVQLDIDTINNTLRLRCRGNTGHNIRWMATIDTVEVTQ